MACMLSYGEALGTNLVWMSRIGEGLRRNPMGLKEASEAKSSGGHLQTFKQRCDQGQLETTPPLGGSP